MGRSDGIGPRVARWRDIAGLTQQQLADRVERSQAYISQIENGQRAVTSRALLIALATALGVSMTDLTGQPLRPRSADELEVWATAPAVRAVLDEDLERAPRPLAVLTAVTDEVMRARMECDYPLLRRELPDLIADTRALANAEGVDERPALALFVRAAVCASLTLKPYGNVDLAMRLAERAARAADLLGEPVERAAAAFAVAQAALAGSSRRRSLSLAVSAAAALGDTGDDSLLTWYAMLHLHAGLSASSLQRSDDAAAHLEEAARTVARIGSDPWRMEATGANVGIWRVGAALENGEPGRAPELARRIDRSAVRTRQRRARLHIDTGRGYYEAAQPDLAVRQFLAADDVSPQEVRSRPTVREIVAQMVRDARRQGSSELRDLAVRMGIDPLNVEPAA